MYRLKTSLFNEYHYVEFVNQQQSIIDFFVLNNGDDRFLNFTEIFFQAQTGFNLKNIKLLDYLEGFMDIHIFSENFKENLENKLSDEITFYPCKILCQGEKLSFYIAKYKKYLDIIDQEKSEYSTYSDGVKKLENPVFKSVLDFNYAVRDINNKVISLVSEKFVELSREHNLNIEYNKV